MTSPSDAGLTPPRWTPGPSPPFPTGRPCRSSTGSPVSAAQHLAAEHGCGPASFTEEGHARLRALEDRLQALEAELPTLTAPSLVTRLNSAADELVAIAQQEIERDDGGPDDAEVVAVRSS